MKLNDELPGGERQDTRRAQGMVDYARLCVRLLRNQPRPSELQAPGAYEMTWRLHVFVGWIMAWISPTRIPKYRVARHAGIEAATPMTRAETGRGTAQCSE